MQRELCNKSNTGCAVGILNSPDPSFSPKYDDALICKYFAKNHVLGKKKNKRFLQQTLGLIQDTRAPVIFWPSRLDSVQKGCQLMAEILYKVVSRYWKQNLEIVFIADGKFQRHFKEIVRFHKLSERVAICGFNERLARLAYGASDFVLMPSSFEPCGLPQMIGPIYGALPVVHDTGGIHDTVVHLDVDRNTGNGFLFKTFDQEGLSWAIDQAMNFYMLPIKEKEQQNNRIMLQSACRFNHRITAQNYIDLYEKMLQRPLINPENVESRWMNKNSGKKETYVQDIVDLIANSTETADQPFSDNSDKQNIISLSEREWSAEEQQSKLLRVNQ
jgi:starch synthase/alpha-amylase